MTISYSGNLKKMQTALSEPSSDGVSTPHYQCVIGEELVPFNEQIGKTIQIDFMQSISCVHCGRKTNKSFSQGYCYPCFKSLAQCDMCIMSPERCHYDAGTCREPEWADEFCMQDHYVYLANTSKLKVGITRGTQIPTRWIDQGATQALPIHRVSTRKMAGLVEVIYKQHVADKTSWQAMLKAAPEPIDIVAKADALKAMVDSEIAALQDQHGIQAVQPCDAAQIVTIDFPVTTYPEKVKSFNLDKTPSISGQLEGIKGQYLLLDSGVINLRKYAGYQVKLSIS